MPEELLPQKKASTSHMKSLRSITSHMNFTASHILQGGIFFLPEELLPQKKAPLSQESQENQRKKASLDITLPPSSPLGQIMLLLLLKAPA